MKLASAALAIFAILPSTNAGLRGITNEKDDLHAQPNVFSSKNNGNGSDGNGNGNNESNIGNRPGKPDTVPTEQGNNSKPNGPNGNAFGHSTSKGQIILGGGKGQGKGLGTIDNSSVLAAQEGGKRVLQSLSKNGDKQKFKAKNSNTKHLRFTQEVHGMEVEGAALFVHTDDLGEVIGINGELVDGETVPSEPTLDAAVSMKTALKEALIPEEAHAQCNEPTTLAVVRGLEDGKAYLAWTCTAQYNTVDKDGVVSPNSDKIFARATGEPGLIQSHPEIYGASPSIQTYNCNNLSENNIIQGATCEALVSSSSSKISSGDAAATAAHNHAIDTFEYYSSKFGRNSIDANGMTIRSSVHVGTNYVNAFWYRNQMWYGDGQAGVSKALSLDLDVVAHELTHGVTERTSGLIYQNESGALNEAMSDIMAAFVEQANGADDRSTWLVGEDIWESGEALRSMCDPSAMGDYDYYPTRYTGASDNGGVHWNSGIANLGK
jgi:bacillolysin